MARYLTINSTFKPYTFDELLKPVQLYGEEYARQEAALGELQTKADMWKNIVNETNDPKAYEMYESYMQGIEDITNSLMEGLSPATRKGVLNMTKRYASEIVPIENAYKRRQELIDEQRKALANDDSLLFSTDASMLSLDTLIDNPATSYISASRSKAHKALAEDAKALQDAIRNNPDEWKPILGNQYYERVSTYGFTEQEVYDAIMRNPNANPILTNLLDQHMSKFNAFDNTQKELAYRSVAPALYNAIGKQTINTLQNRDYVSPTNTTVRPEKKSSPFIRISEGVEGETPDLDRLKGLRYSPTTGYSTNNIDLLEQELARQQQVLNQYKDQEEEFERIYKDQLTQKEFIQNKWGSGQGYAAIGQTSNLSTTYKPTGYDKYEKARKRKEELQTKIREEREQIAKIAERYSHLGDDILYNLSVGSTLEQMQAKEQTYSHVFNITPEDMKKVTTNIGTILGSFTKDQIDSGKAGLKDAEGKFVSYDKLNTMIENKDKISLKVRSGKDSRGLVLMYNNEPYTFVGIDAITNFNNDITGVNNFLKDYSNQIADKIINLTPQESNYLTQTGDINNLGLQVKDLVSIPGTNFKGAVLKSSNGDIYKIVFSSQYKPLGFSTLSDELQNEGRKRAEIFDIISNKALSSLFGLFVND